jgi:ParB-like chromosome segregation protein Spo0J
VQTGVDPTRLRPARDDLVRLRLEFQRSLIRRGVPRLTPIQVSREGVIVDGHHAVRAAAEEGRSIDVLVTDFAITGKTCSILDLTLR